MQTCDVVEISRRNGHIPSGLIEACYRASQSGLVVLALDGISPQAVNRILDPVVPTLPLDIPGVLYIDAADAARVQEAVFAAERIFVATIAFRGMVRALGVAPRLIAPVDLAGSRLLGLGMGQRTGHATEPPGERNGAHDPVPARVPAQSQPAPLYLGRYYAL
ncbi:hypothetical protein [Nitratireductor sp. GCM10026969]|uniref:hypothetical protein n=1 Tax=Nitratireductor sp. GCM10026969 TaxID=3252645 RepID=UPI0036141F8A